MDSKIKVKSVAEFQVFNHDKTVLLCEVGVGDELLAELYEPTGEYFAEDSKGREVYIGRINQEKKLEIDENFDLFLPT
ncbi:hypothetical protein JOE49_004003 [Paenibacillus sp. PvR133]|jgi:hypothetical protein|uniref:hypothetical protein n=1 Tax=Paenibacillus sp. PvR133 TaxID=2806598 RepID=UPI001AE95EC3|nr:hypothetical protein [Paenibacillus sp. PvR133]MBP1176751.1 hypothetical protein [Paenibacillus sp. PvR133]